MPRATKLACVAFSARSRPWKTPPAPATILRRPKCRRADRRNKRGPPMDTMMALRAQARGSPEQLVYEQAPAPAAGLGEALIAVHAAAITFAELTWDLSWTTRDGTDRTPVIPSHEMSGTVTGLGAGVADLAVSDEVIGLIDFDRDGAAAEYVVMPAANPFRQAEFGLPRRCRDAAARGAGRPASTGGPRGPGT